MATGDAKIVEEFNRLLEKSKQLFNGLRELPPHGHKHWQAYFGRTFDVYTKLWKFQQQYRQILDAKMGLKRWQIGEIASKIGQLYYHYYLRTSDTSYLFEAFAFYAAIRQRQYYSDIETERRADLVVKKLRYYARFIVVCLLLNRTKLLDDLLIDFAAEIDRFSKSYGPDEQLEWSLVIEELRAFLRADRCVEVLDSTGHLVPLVHRLTPFSATAPMSNMPPTKAPKGHHVQNPFGTFNFPGVHQHLRLQEAVIVGASHAQPRFSELTIDAYRIAQAIERQPEDLMAAASSSPRVYDSSPVPVRRQVGSSTSTTGMLAPHSTTSQPSDRVSPSSSLGVVPSNRRENPHKYLIYRPTFAQLFNCVSAAHRDVSSNGVLLVYLSSDAAGGLPASPQADPRPFSPGTWGMHESGHVAATGDGGHTVSSRRAEMMMSSAMHSSHASADAEVIFGTSTEVHEFSPRTNAELEADSQSVRIKNEDGYDCSPTVLAPTSAGNTYENEARRRRRMKHNRGARPELSISPTQLQPSCKDRNCLYPGDLYPFLRKPLMLIIDSENSSAFSHFPCLFGQPLVALLSPPRLPPPLATRRRDSGGLFTLFLHSPLAAFCFVCGVRSMPVALWDRCQATVHKFLLATCRLFLAPPSDDIDASYVAMFSDDFLRSLVLRFVFCHYVMSCHVTTTVPVLVKSKSVDIDTENDATNDNSSLMPVLVTPHFLPLACPQLPQERILADLQLYSILADLAATLSILDQFPCLAALGPAPQSGSYSVRTDVYSASHTYQNVSRTREKQRKGQRASSATRPSDQVSTSHHRSSPPPLPPSRIRPKADS